MASVARYCCCAVDCFEAGTACTHCDATPQSYVLTLSGHTVDTSTCYARGAGSVTFISGNINGAQQGGVFGFNTQSVSACNWSGAAALSADTVRESYVFNTTCAGAPTSTLGDPGTWYLERTSTTWILSHRVSDGGGDFLMFYDVQSATGTECFTLPVFTNDLVSGDIGSTHGPTGLLVAGYGGTVTGVCTSL